MGKLTKLTVYMPPARCAAIRTKVLRKHRSVSAYLKQLIEQDQAVKPDPVQAEIDRIFVCLGELLEFSRYNTVVQNATADRLGPGLLDDIQERYRKKYGSTPDAR